ncbi:MAG TPA: Uma2 family endonuclease [Bryobacteraceae bacterium]|jgi:Uma2 family endonuclease
MSTVGTVLATWQEFLRLPDEEDGIHQELHDGEVVLVPSPRAIHVYIQSLLVRWLTNAAAGRGWADKEFPYRPAANLQFRYADIAYVPAEDWKAMRGNDYPIYAPPLIIEVLSPSNTLKKINRQRVTAFSAGTREFWLVDPAQRSIDVSLSRRPIPRLSAL